MTALELLLAEQWPDGTFAGPRPRPAPWTPDEQARHCADLEAALDGWAWDEAIRNTIRRNQTRKAA